MLAPSIVQVEPDGCYGATLTVRLHEKMWDTEQTISGFIVGIRTERSDDLPNMNHVDLEVFHPNDDVISNHLVTLHVTQLKPPDLVQVNVCCLYPQGRSSVAVSDVITTEATPVMDTYLWSRVRVKINKFVYDTMDEMQKLEGFHPSEPSWTWRSWRRCTAPTPWRSSAPACTRCRCTQRGLLEEQGAGDVRE